MKLPHRTRSPWHNRYDGSVSLTRDLLTNRPWSESCTMSQSLLVRNTSWHQCGADGDEVLDTESQDNSSLNDSPGTVESRYSFSLEFES